MDLNVILTDSVVICDDNPRTPLRARIVSPKQETKKSDPANPRYRPGRIFDPTRKVPALNKFGLEVAEGSEVLVGGRVSVGEATVWVGSLAFLRDCVSASFAFAQQLSRSLGAKREINPHSTKIPKVTPNFPIVERDRNRS